MIEIIIYIVAFLIMFPMFATTLLYFGCKAFKIHKIKAFHISVQWTTILYIISTMMLCLTLFGQSFIGVILIGFIFLMMILMIYQWKKRTEIVFSRVFKVSWRMSFLIYSFIYMLLIIYGVTTSIVFY